jgi:hypothetical protein
MFYLTVLLLVVAIFAWTKIRGNRDKTTDNYTWKRGVFDADELRAFSADVLECQELRDAQAWQQSERFFGTFEFLYSDMRRNRTLVNELVAPKLERFVDKLAPLASYNYGRELRFNEVFVQRYGVGCSVGEHRDPGTLIGLVVIAVFGDDDFEGGKLVIEGQEIDARPGDVVLMRAADVSREKGRALMMPLHHVTEVTKGTRCTLIVEWSLSDARARDDPSTLIID